MRFVFLLIVAFGAPALSDEYYNYGIGLTPADPLSFDKLASAVTDAQHPLHCVEEVLAWIARTHSPFLEHFTLLRESRSSQGATPKDPRSVVFQSDGRFVLTFNGDAQQTGFDKIELIHFRDGGKASPVGDHFEFREIQFTNGHAEISEANPHRCQQCHQTPLRPIWAPYEIWPGSYGKYDDSLPDYAHDKYAYHGESDDRVKEQTAALHEFQAYAPAWRQHARYRYLKFPQGSAVSPFSEQYRGDYKFRPNLHLTHLLGLLHARAVAGQLSANSACFEAYQPLLMAALLDCHGEISQTTEPAISQGLKDAANALRASYPGGEKAGGKYQYSGPDDLASLLALMGVEKEQWNPDENPAVWHYYVGDADLAGIVADALYPQSRRLSPELPPVSVMEAILRPDVDGYGERDASDDPEGAPRIHHPTAREQVCQVWTQRLATFTPQPALCKQNPLKMAPAVVGMCASCHDGHTPRAPVIAFETPGKLNAQWKQKIAERIGAEGPTAMPPIRPLTQGERRALRDYLELN